MNNQYLYDFQHDSVRKHFEQNVQNKNLYVQIQRYRLTPKEITDWLNNYTTLLNVWFCELLYYPTQTDNKNWEFELCNQLQNMTILPIEDIIRLFEIKTLQYNDYRLNGIEDLTINLSYYVNLYKHKRLNFFNDTLAGQRMNLTCKKFIDIRKSHKEKLTMTLKKEFPFDISMIITQELSYLDIVNDESDREKRIIDYLMRFDRECARPILVDYGYVEEY
ncbi:MAG: hypothetical protein IKB81_01185 [Paludibacteraceae bacterium]|nr:hypothetical protein [Paludibacteraceae bacterium]